MEASVKIRFGVGLGADTTPQQLPAVIDALEEAGIDSVWFSELVYTEAIDPFIGMATALARTTQLKVGTSVAVLPGGRHPVLVAKQLAALAALGPKRVLPAFGLRSATPAEREIFAVPDGRRAAVFDESMRLLRAVLTETSVDFRGEFFRVEGASVGTLPSPPLDIWLGGAVPAAFRRVGRLADGWLGSFLTPAEARNARETIQAEAAAADREIEPDHFGISVLLANGDIPEPMAAAVRARRPDTDVADLLAADWDHLHRLLDGYIDAGLSKFVIIPVGADDTGKLVAEFERELLPRQN